MNVTSTEQAKGGIQVTQPILQANTEFRAVDHLASNFVRDAQPGPRRVGYGLPCSKCGTYYTADLSVCPVCKCGERISPTTLPARAGLQNAQPDARELKLKEAYEPFPKKFRSQLFSTHLQINTAVPFSLQPRREPSGWARTSSDLQTLL